MLGRQPATAPVHQPHAAPTGLGGTGSGARGLVFGAFCLPPGILTVETSELELRRGKERKLLGGGGVGLVIFGPPSGLLPLLPQSSGGGR